VRPYRRAADPEGAPSGEAPREGLRSRRAALSAAALPLGGVVAAACGAPGSGSAPGSGAAGGSRITTPVTIGYLSFFSPDDPQTISFPHVLQQFQQQYPNAVVEQTSTSGTGGTVMEKYLTLISAGTPPDVAAVNPQFIEPLWSKGALADLTAYVKRDARTFQPEDFNEATLLRAVRGGKWQALPLQMGLWFLFYNAGALAGAGVPPPDGSWTWNRLLEAAVTVRQRDPNSLGLTAPPYELPVRGNGGDILSADEKRCVLDQPPAVEAVEWLGELRQKHRAVPDPAETGGQTTRALFDSGRYAFHTGDPGFLSGTLRGKLSFPWDIAIVPRGRVAHVDTVKGPSLVLSAGIKQPEAAWAWLAHYNGIEMQRYIATNGKIVSARKSALKAFVDLPEGYNKQAIAQAAAIARPMPYVPRYDEMDREIQAGLNAVYAGQRTARDAMVEVVQKVNPLLSP
jgi:multiple sugar transport system substrate-binding protein